MNKRQTKKLWNAVIENLIVDRLCRVWILTPEEAKLVRRHRKRLHRKWLEAINEK